MYSRDNVLVRYRTVVILLVVNGEASLAHVRVRVHYLRSILTRTTSDAQYRQPLQREPRTKTSNWFLQTVTIGLSVLIQSTIIDAGIAAHMVVDSGDIIDYDPSGETAYHKNPFPTFY